MNGVTLILGANGFIGRNIAECLHRRSIPLVLFDLKFNPPYTLAENENVQVVEGNFFNRKDLLRALKNVDNVLHFISTTVPSTSINNLPIEIETNVTATARLLEAMVENGVGFIGFPSSGGTVYGTSHEAHQEHETLIPTCPYGLGKLMIEEMIRFFQTQHGIDYQIWRVSNPYGDKTKLHTNQGVIDSFLFKVDSGRPLKIWGKGDAIRDFIYIDDLTAAISTLLDNGDRNQVFNIGSGIGTSINRVIDVICDITGSEVGKEFVDKYTGPSSSILNIDRLVESTGWRPVYTIETGIEAAWNKLQDLKRNPRGRPHISK